jgi:hypothetical protein
MWLPEFWNCFDNVMRSIHQTGSKTGGQVQNMNTRNPSRQRGSVAALLTVRLATVWPQLIECSLNGDARETNRHQGTQVDAE